MKPAIWMTLTRKPAVIAAAFIIVLFGVVLWADGSRYRHIPCRMDCGETYVAHQQVAQYQRYGFSHALIQDHATSDDIAAHPYLYTHNVSIPAVIFPLLRALGVTEFWMLQLVTLAVTLAGLVYVFRATSFHTGSALVGCIMLALIASDVLHVFGFGLNALRAWHWLVLFGLAYHAGKLMRAAPGERWLQRMLVALFAALSFGIGYDFWVICGAFAGMLVLLERPTIKRISLEYIWLFVAFALPLVLRQLHIGYALGWGFWWQDFLISGGIKVPFLRNIVVLPSLEEIDSIYRSHGILRAPASQAPDWTSIGRTARDMAHFIGLQAYGLLGMFLLALVIVATPLVAVLRKGRRVTAVLNAVRAGWLQRVPDDVRGGGRLLLALAFGCVCGLAIFAPLSLHIYLKHQFPLLAAPVMLAKAVVIAAAWHGLRSRLLPYQGVRWACAALLAVVVIDHAAIQLRQATVTEPMSTAWSDAVRQRRDASFVVSWISDAVDGYARGWSVGLPPGAEREIVRRIQSGEKVFSLSDYILFGQRDAEQRGKTYERPDYWLYFKTDHMSQFDHVSPECRTDLWLDAWNTLNAASSFMPSGGLWLQKGEEFAPGSMFILGGAVASVRRGDVARIVVNDQTGAIAGEANFNCMYMTFAATLQVPQNETRDKIVLTATAISPQGASRQIGQITLAVEPDGPRFGVTDLMPWSRQAQPSPAELAAMLPQLPVAARGADYIIFDLRGIYAEN